jgi:hypothetical protein
MGGVSCPAFRLGLLGHCFVGIFEEVDDRWLVLGVGVEKRIFQEDHRRGVIPGLDQAACLRDRAGDVSAPRDRASRQSDGKGKAHQADHDTLGWRLYGLIGKCHAVGNDSWGAPAPVKPGTLGASEVWPESLSTST